LKVYNMRHKNAPSDAVYVGRPSKWGNPYEIGRDGTREDVIQKYRELVEKTPWFQEEIKQLKGKDLVCWGAPSPCHADILLEYANKS